MGSLPTFPEDRPLCSSAGLRDNLRQNDFLTARALMYFCETQPFKAFSITKYKILKFARIAE